jgi:6-phosphogluconolactonase/glucosamine-6-phosphate isomerase/deaminase
MPLELRAEPDTAALADHAATVIETAMRRYPRGLFCLAAGDTPRATYKKLALRLVQTGFDTTGLRFVALDEWQGLAPDSPGSCQRFLRETLLDPLGIADGRAVFFDALGNPDEACRAVASRLREWGPLTMAVLGIGRNGHLGFNEPGTAADTTVRPVALESGTIEVGAKYFPDGRAPALGLTLGLGDLLAAQQVLVLAAGSSKRGIVRRALDPDSFPEVPAAVLHRHPRATLLADSAASDRNEP